MDACQKLLFQQEVYCKNRYLADRKHVTMRRCSEDPQPGEVVIAIVRENTLCLSLLDMFQFDYLGHFKLKSTLALSILLYAPQMLEMLRMSIRVLE